MKRGRSNRSESALQGVLDRFTFGGRLPGGVGIILAVTIVMSLLAALGDRHLTAFFDLLSLSPVDVLHGQVWRLVSWSLIERSLFALLFGCLTLFWFGKDLALEWGSRRFFVVYAAVALVAGCGTCLIALVDPNVREHVYLGSAHLGAAIMVGWGLCFPDRYLRLYFVIRVRGTIVAWGTVALTVGFAIYQGWGAVLPALFAEGAMLAWLFRGPLRRWWLKQRLARTEASLAREKRAKAAKRMASVHTLYALEERDDDLPPLTPEMEGKLGQIFDLAAQAEKKRRKGEDEPN